ncbi:MAG: Mur ligase family protein, partial [Mariprofundaceae bacterium]|nr:Mur ligase family protein [Mariprofundaceae bacterium]
MRLTGQELAAATQGIWHQGHLDDVTFITTDSRHFQQGAVFLALRGDSFDGHQFAPDAASALIGDSEGVKAWVDGNIPYLEVSDTLQALGDIAHAWRMKLAQTTVIGITGSYGKTTVRSMLHHLLTGLGLHVHATNANLNNLIGVPQTILATPIDADVALIECGISEQGEMQRLANILSPDGVVMTGMTSAHSEGLGGLEGVV